MHTDICHYGPYLEIKQHISNMSIGQTSNHNENYNV